VLPLRILFTCGGTAGHINPALALAGALRQRRPDTEILFAGATRGMENELVPRRAIRSGRCPSCACSAPSTLSHQDNLKSIRAYPAAQRQAASIIREFDPDVVAGMGGYASEPFVRQAAKCGIPTLIHESNAVPGLTTKSSRGMRTASSSV
jgi:UDP-N-acetylglucosamine--N-acetylmuramyl-(pentapeptide) pyrophosphoryl-undecaprenol N-acetylglucosamine transferase